MSFNCFLALFFRLFSIDLIQIVSINSLKSSQASQRGTFILDCFHFLKNIFMLFLSYVFIVFIIL